MDPTRQKSFDRVLRAYNVAPEALSSASRYAIESRNPQALAKLLRSSSSKAHLQFRKQQLLHEAVKSGSPALLRVALPALKSQIELGDSNGDTPLHLATAQGNLSMIKLLLQEGAKISSLNIKKQTPLYLAAKLGNNAAINALLGVQRNLNQLGQDGRTLLSQTLIYGTDYWVVSGLMENLIKYGADVNSRNLDGTTPIFHALTWHESIQKRLIAAGAKVNQRNIEGESPMHIAIPDKEEKNPYLKHRLNVIDRMVKAGAQVNLIDEIGEIPLHRALTLRESKEQNRLTEKLIDLGSNVNLPDSFGEHPIYTAAEMDNLAMVEKLLSAGAKITPEIIGSLKKLYGSRNLQGFDRYAVDREMILERLTRALNK